MKNTFNGLTNLKEIDFHINQIKEIHPNAFNGLAYNSFLKIIYYH